MYALLLRDWCEDFAAALAGVRAPNGANTFGDGFLCRWQPLASAVNQAERSVKGVKFGLPAQCSK